METCSSILALRLLWTEQPGSNGCWGECKHVYDGDCDAICNKCSEERPVTHDYKEATCIQPKTCKDCGKTDGNALGHTWASADCDSPKTCTVCGTTEGSALNHNYGSPTYAWNADNTKCTATRVCLNDESHVQTQSASVTSTISKQATCLEKGETTYVATFADSAFATQTKTVENLAIDSSNHTAGEVKYVWSADNTECVATLYCGRESSHVVKTESASVTSSVSKQATCLEKGETTYVATFADSAFATQTKTVENLAIDSSNHTAGEVKYVWSADNTECVATLYCGLDVNHIVLTENATVSVEETGDSSTGLTKTYTAEFNNTAFTKQTKTETFSTDEVEHAYGDPIVEWNADYTDCTVTRVCSNDNYTDDTLTKIIETESDGAKTVTVYAEGVKIAFFVYKQKTTGDGYYLYRSEIKQSNSIEVKSYDENGNCTSEGYRLVFEGYAPDSDDSEFG